MWGPRAPPCGSEVQCTQCFSLFAPVHNMNVCCICICIYIYIYLNFPHWGMNEVFFYPILFYSILFYILYITNKQKQTLAYATCPFDLEYEMKNRKWVQDLHELPPYHNSPFGEETGETQILSFHLFLSAEQSEPTRCTVTVVCSGCQTGWKVAIRSLESPAVLAPVAWMASCCSPHLLTSSSVWVSWQKGGHLQIYMKQALVSCLILIFLCRLCC